MRQLSSELGVSGLVAVSELTQTRILVYKLRARVSDASPMRKHGEGQHYTAAAPERRA